MGNRNRNGTIKLRQQRAIAVHAVKKEFTRAKAMKELSDGGDFNDIKFTNHRNYHVRMRAFQMAGAVVPDNVNERQALFETLARGRSLNGVEMVRGMLGMNDDNNKERAA